MLFAAHWLIVEQFVKQVVVLHAYFPQLVVVAFGHVPVPLQVAELVWVPLLQLGS